MKKLVLILMILFASGVSASISQVGPGEIEVSSEGLFAFVDNNWVEVDSLYRVPSGQYEIELRAEESERVATTWSCPHCGHINGFHRRTCANCGKHPMQT